jgi:hypothetical protein
MPKHHYMITLQKHFHGNEHASRERRGRAILLCGCFLPRVNVATGECAEAWWWRSD